MISAPRYSILLPVFNAEKTLVEALNSIWAQSFENFEVLAIEDGSTDRSREILERIQDSRLRVIHQPENLKLIAALNRGIDEARAEWIVRMDADDRMMPERLELLERWRLERPDVDLFGGNAWKIDDKGRRFGKLKKAQGTGPSRTMRLEDLWEPSPFIHPTVALRTSIAREYRYRPEALHCEDYELWLRLARDGVALVQRSEIVLEYRISEGSVSTLHRDAQLRSGFAVFQAHFPKAKLSFKEFESLLGVVAGPTSWRRRIELIHQIYAGRRPRLSEYFRQLKRVCG